MRLGDTPVLIPNTMVKTLAADDTMLETAWESRWLPNLWGYSSVGRAPALQAGGHEFESRYLHSVRNHREKKYNNVENLGIKTSSVIGMLPMLFQKKTLMKINFQRVSSEKSLSTMVP